jgi:hypothetical protein
MSSHAASAPAVFPQEAAPNGSKALIIGVIGLLVTLIGIPVSGGKVVAMSWLVGVSYWTAIAIGMLMMVMIHHVFDASWSVVIRRQWEHGLSAFFWLLLLFLPLIILSWIPGYSDIVWPWMNPNHIVHGAETVSEDVLYVKKSGFLSVPAFTVLTIGFFGLWIWLSARLRKASFTQDSDGSPEWTRMNRFTSGFGIPIGALTLTAAAIYWLKSLEYHWFSTMYGVWYFANCVRGALCFGVIIMCWLYNRGDYRGILHKGHLHSIGQLMLAFTIFWAYVSFAQYFLIWNANVPEETFWYNIREINADGSPNQWKYVGIIIILFGHFVVPFILLLSYKNKIIKERLRGIAYWVLAIIFFDICYNSLPALKDVHGNPLPLFNINLLWTITATIGVGGVCFWAYLNSFSKAKLIPIRDPRIEECLQFHDQYVE